MGLLYAQGDILDIKKGLICHQVNCKGKMGAGLAWQIRIRYEKAYQDYIKAYREGKLKLGNVISSQIDENLYVLHMCGQNDYGNNRNIIYTDYQAVQACLRGVHMTKKLTGLQVYFPYKIGCGLGGADWRFINEYIENIIPDATIMMKKGTR